MHYWLLMAVVYVAECRRYFHPNNDELHFSKYEQGPRIDRHSFFLQKFRLGYKLQLFCKAEGMPVPDVRWYKDGVEIRQRPGVWIRNSAGLDFTASHLHIDPARMLDAGEYECVANNSLGYHLQHMRAQVQL